jgi:dihydroorotate dehydrogenase
MLIPGVIWLFRKMYLVQNEQLRVNKKGLSFPNPVGLAAGFDKNATLYKDFQHLGFGFIEVGTVTPKAQDGNPKPRLFRLPNDRALINRMGFNNFGVDAMVNQLKNRPKDLIVGGNIGKNKVTPEELAHEDYLICFYQLYDSVDYFAVNVSSPNTPGLRNLQGKEPLRKLLTSIVEARKSKSVSKPILLKIAPDMNDSQLDDVVEIVLETGIDGIIATNTTISRDGLNSRSYEIKACGDGGLSGWPLKARSTRIVKMVRERLTPEHLIIGCGGIETAEDAIEKLEAGADLVQIYTGFIYEGPALVKRINQAILTR